MWPVYVDLGAGGGLWRMGHEGCPCMAAHTDFMFVAACGDGSCDMMVPASQDVTRKQGRVATVAGPLASPIGVVEADAVARRFNMARPAEASLAMAKGMNAESFSA